MKNLGKSTDIVGRRGDGQASAWIPIAIKERHYKHEAGWVDIPEAPMTRKDALEAQDAGRLFLACRYTDDTIEAVIQYRAPKP